MGELLRFDDRVAIVTGAGSSPGLGRSYARYLAARGARVIVNDVSSQRGSDGLTNAERVAKEIVDDGGIALADGHSVAEPEAARAIVATALATWGRIDILVNNAGINIPASFAEITDADVRRLVDVHLFGHLWMSKAVWTPMIEAGYGRILNTSSGVMHGLSSEVVYGAAKGGIFSLTRGLAVEGAPHGILVNTIAPSAGTAGAHSLAPDDSWMNDVYVPNYSPDLVAPLGTYLLHDSCVCTARFFSSGGGHVSEGFFSNTPGVVDREISIEGIRDRFDEIAGRDGSAEAADPIEASKHSAFTPKAYRPS